MSLDDDKEAFRNFSKAFLINFIFGIINMIFIVIMVAWAISTTVMPMGSGEIEPTGPIYAFFIPSVILSLIGNIIFVYYLWHGFKIMETVMPNVSIGKIGALLLLFSSFSLPIIFPIFWGAPSPNFQSPVAYFGLFSIFGVVGLIGIILLVIAIYRIGEKYDNTTIKVGAIIYIFLSFIAAIVLYFGFKELENMKSGKNSVILPPQPPW